MLDTGFLQARHVSQPSHLRRHVFLDPQRSGQWLGRASPAQSELARRAVPHHPSSAPPSQRSGCPVGQILHRLLSSSCPNVQLYSILRCCQDVVVLFETQLLLPRRTRPRERLVHCMETELYNGQMDLDMVERVLYNLSRMGNGGAWPTSLQQTLSNQPLCRGNGGPVPLSCSSESCGLISPSVG